MGTAIQINILEFVLAYSDMYDPAEKIAIPPDADDNKFLECAVQRVRGLSSREKKISLDQAAWPHQRAFDGGLFAE